VDVQLTVELLVRVGFLLEPPIHDGLELAQLTWRDAYDMLLDHLFLLLSVHLATREIGL
jgi:hypothetical protein